MPGRSRVAIDTDKLDDTRLMLCFQRGDESCFEELVKRHKQRVMNFVYRFLHGCDGAEEIARCVFVRVYKSRDSYEASKEFSAWLYALCKETCYDVISNSKVPRILSFFMKAPELSHVGKVPRSGYLSASASQMNDGISMLVKRSVDALPHQQRMAFILSRYEKCSYAECAVIMDCAVDSVRATLHRAKMTLMERMRGYLQ